jgi:hypothetical protein
MKHWTSTLDIGRAQRIAVSWSQMHTGVSWSIFLDVETPLPHFQESHWLRSVRNFLKSIHGSFRLDHSYVPSIQRIHDSHIMDHVLSSGQFRPIEVRAINYCRLYLQAVTVSDITDATGTRLFHGVTRGSVTEILSTTKWHLTYQAKPDIASWKLWKKACDLFATSGVLHVQLLDWKYPSFDQRRQWSFYYDPASDTLFNYSQEQYHNHQRWHQQFSFHSLASVTILPLQSYPVDVRKKLSGWQIVRHSSIIPPLPTPVSTTFIEYCDHLEYWEQVLLHNVVLLFSPEETMQKLESSPFRACSDGSAAKHQGTFGWALALSDRTRIAYGSGNVDGHDPQSFRSEAQGMLSVVRFLFRLRQWTKSEATLSGTLATDNTGLVDRAKAQSAISYSVPNSTFQSDWDVVQAIVNTVSSASLDVAYTHVKGHQDKDTEYDSLPFLAQLNVDADELAGEFQKKFGSHRPVIPLSPTRPIALDLSGHTVHRHLKSLIRDAAHAGPLLERMILRNSWAPEVHTTIDWEVHRLATSVHRLHRSHFTKLCHGYLPAGKIAHRNNPSHPDWCPLCKHPHEEHAHILQCPHVTRATWRSKLITTLASKCDSLSTDPILKSILINGITCWLNQTPFDEGGIPSDYHLLLETQRHIGWYHVFLAQVSVHWAQLQDKYLKSSYIQSKQLTGDKWSKAICTVVTTLWLELWAQRNTDRHGVDSSTKSIAAREQALRELVALYQYKDKVLQKHRSIFTIDIQVHSQGDTNYIRQWINTNQAVITKSAKDARIKSITNVRIISSYFPLRGSQT